MTETDRDLFTIIAYEKTLRALSSQMKLTERQVYQRLVRIQDKGYTLKRRIYENGNQSFVLSDGLIYPKMHTTTIEGVTNTFRAFLLSDIHLGNVEECPDLLKHVMQYVTDNDINFIINCGDTIDGYLGPRPKKITDAIEQIEYALKNIPYDRNVMYLNLGGNHEHSVLEQEGLNALTAFERRRPDFIPLGFGFGIINLADDQIVAVHRTDKVYKGTIDNKVVLSGHRHRMGTQFRRNGILFNVPAFCTMEMGKVKSVPRAIDMTLSFGNGHINRAIMKQVEFTPQAKLVATEDLEFKLPSSRIAEEDLLSHQKQEELPPRKSIPKCYKKVPQAGKK